MVGKVFFCTFFPSHKKNKILFPAFELIFSHFYFTICFLLLFHLFALHFCFCLPTLSPPFCSFSFPSFSCQFKGCLPSNSLQFPSHCPPLLPSHSSFIHLTFPSHSTLLQLSFSSLLFSLPKGAREYTLATLCLTSNDDFSAVFYEPIGGAISGSSKLKTRSFSLALTKKK